MCGSQQGHLKIEASEIKRQVISQHNHTNSLDLKVALGSQDRILTCVIACVNIRSRVYMQLLTCQVISASGISTSIAACHYKAAWNNQRLTEGKAYMGTTRFADFEVWIGSATLPSMSNTPGVFPVQVFISPAGPATGELTLPINDADFQAELIQVRSIDPNLELRKAFGKRLFEALFTGKVRDTWVASRGRVNAGEADGLRLRLRIDEPELAALPWELLWDEQTNNFLATSADLVVSRYLPVPEPPVLLIEGQLRILLVVESPPGVPVVEHEEVERIETALHTLGETVFVQVSSNLKMSEIENALQQQDYHVLHFLGHGTGGKLIVTGKDGRATSIDDEEFAQVVLGRRSLRLVVLNACHSSQVDQAGLFAGVGPALVQKGLSAVIAMQYPFVQVDTASRFSEAFYAALANGLPVDLAVNAGRRVLSAGLLDSRDWSTPVLYMGTRSGHILGTVERAWREVHAAAQGSAGSKAALAELAQSFRDLVSRHQQLETLMALDRYLRDLRTDFEPCTEVVERVGDWRNLGPSDLNDLSRTWQRVRQNRVDPLRVFVKSHPNVDTIAWFPEVETQTATIDSELAKVALGRLIKSVSDYGNQLAQAEAYVRQQLDQALDNLMVFSARTLGRLDMP